MAKLKFDCKVLYEKTRKILPEKNTRLNKKRVLLNIKKLSNEIKCPFQILIWNYLDEGLIINDAKSEYFYNNIFKDELKKDNNPVMYTYFFMKFEGLEDLATLDMVSGKLEGGNTEKIYLHSLYDTPTLIVGETGTSKQLTAKIIHELSSRKTKPFLNINCVALSEGLFVSELFGYKKGAFTGATKDKDGLLKKADGGIFFLDELGKLEHSLQAKLLKVIEEKEFTRVGDIEPQKINVKFIAAVQPEDIEENRIIPDLLYRLGYPESAELPTLNKRLSIAPKTVIKNSLKKALIALNIDTSFSINDEALKKLTDYRYKGNYRELESILGVAVKLARLNKRDEILPEDLEKILKKDAVKAATEKTFRNVMLKDIIDYADKKKEAIVKNKLDEIYKTGKTLKTALSSEGMNGSHYDNLRAKFERIVGKKFLKKIRSKYN